MTSKACGVAALALAAGVASAQVIAFDTADDSAYDAGWADGSNGGFGYGGWSFQTEANGGFAGRFLAGAGGGASNSVNGSGRAWALFANNGPGLERSTAFRGINASSLGQAGTSLEITLEHGGIATGGLVGVSLRTGNVAASAGDYSADALTQFYFEGGDGNYTVADAGGETDTGAGFTFDGVRVRFVFTGGGMFNLEVDRFFSETGDFDTITTTGLSLAGAGPIESIAVFNDDGGDAGGLNDDAYFNNLTVTVPAPGAAGLVVLSGVLAARRRR
ncbi:MAG: hypothetical protein AAF356_07770 [Planctomycetota bacterium]